MLHINKVHIFIPLVASSAVGQVFQERRLNDMKKIAIKLVAQLFLKAMVGLKLRAYI